MTHKTLAIALLFIFLSACAPATQTSEVSKTSEVLTPTATSTFTPEPTATLTPIPTATPFQYTSCVDPELIMETKNTFLEKMGMSVEEYMQKLIQVGAYKTQDGFVLGTEETIYYNIVFAGSAEVSLTGKGDFSAGDMAFCVYFNDDTNPSVLIPVVVGFTHNGEYVNTLSLSDRSDGGYDHISPTSMTELKNWWEGKKGGPALGDVFEFYYVDFESMESPKDIESFDQKSLTYKDAIIRFLELLDDDYLSKIPGTGVAVEAVERLDTTNVGLVASRAGLMKREPLPK